MAKLRANLASIRSSCGLWDRGSRDCGGVRNKALFLGWGGVTLRPPPHSGKYGSHLSLGPEPPRLSLPCCLSLLFLSL